MTALNYVLQQTINAFSLGSIYALVAIGLAMVFGILRLINFAHGDLMMVACYSAFFLVSTGIAIIPVIVIAILVTTILGILMERIAYRPVRGAPDVIMLLTSLAVSIFIENMGVMFLSPVARSFGSVTPPFFNSSTVSRCCTSLYNYLPSVAPSSGIIFILCKTLFAGLYCLFRSNAFANNMPIK